MPFDQEFEHLKKYLYIEKLRFADKLNIAYDITVTDFVLPLLSIQPLVENAVKHGVGMKKKGGTVKILCLDDEPLALKMLETCVKQAKPEAQVLAYDDQDELLMEAEKNGCDIRS